MCVIETPADVLAVEQATGFQGLYFVLMGHLSPLDGIGPVELGLDMLEQALLARGIGAKTRAGYGVMAVDAAARQDVEAEGARTLVLSTRPAKPLESTELRTVMRPSAPAEVNKFSVTDADGLRKAYELGLRDGEAFAPRTEAHGENEG